MNRCMQIAAVVFIVISVFTGSAVAQAVVVEIQTQATGATAELAFRRGVADAATQVSAPFLVDSTKKQRFADSLRDLDAALAVPSQNLASMIASVKAASRGLIDHVNVLENREAGTERQLTMLVGVARFDNGFSSRRTIAVMPFRAASSNFEFAGSPVQGDELARRLADATLEQLVKSGVLTVLDRQNVDSVAKERNFVESYGRTPEELARFGRMLGADLLLVGSMETGGLEITTQIVQASGYTFARAFAGLSVAARLLDVETGAIVWADTIGTHLDNSQLSRMFGGSAPDASGTMSALVHETAASLVSAIVDTVAPIKVALVDGDAVWLNRGTGRLSEGMRLQVRGGGQDVIDPDTGENLGQAERTVAVIEVMIVHGKKSQCRILEGRPEDVRAGQVARELAFRGGGGAK
ncbi:MAG: CsgG/HfaB family protein [Phycisphaerae bacterium]|nr:CsgG/HfaB family protein [Phycisphaerae bacterium]